MKHPDRRRVALKVVRRIERYTESAAVEVALTGMREGEKFVFAMVDVPHFERKLQVILLLMLFPQQSASLAGLGQLRRGAARMGRS